MKKIVYSTALKLAAVILLIVSILAGMLILTGGDAPGSSVFKIRDAAVNAPGYEEGKPEILFVDDFAESIRAAQSRAKEGDVVLLSPASASFDCFKNFMERGNRFKKLVKEL